MIIKLLFSISEVFYVVQYKDDGIWHTLAQGEDLITEDGDLVNVQSAQVGQTLLALYHGSMYTATIQQISSEWFCLFVNLH